MNEKTDAALREKLSEMFGDDESSSLVEQMREMVVDSAMDVINDFIADSKPDDIFDEDDLTEWAESNDFKKVE